MLVALSRVCALLSLCCFLIALFLPWFSIRPASTSGLQNHDVVIIQTSSRASAPSLSLFAAPLVVSLACLLVCWPLKTLAWLGGVLTIAAGAAAIPLMFIFSGKVASWSLSEAGILHTRHSGWWLGFASSILAVLSGACAALSSLWSIKCRSGERSDIKDARATIPDVESIRVDTPKKQTEVSFPEEKLPTSNSLRFDVTPVYDQKRGDWFAASSNPLFSDPGRGSGQLLKTSSQDFIPALRTVPHLGDLERLQFKSEQRWISGSESLREKVEHSTERHILPSSDDED